MKIFVVTILLAISIAVAGQAVGDQVCRKRCRRGETCIYTVAYECENTLCDVQETCVDDRELRKTCEGKQKTCRGNKECRNKLLNCQGRTCPIEAHCLPVFENCGYDTCTKRETCVQTVPYYCDDSTCPKEGTCVRREDAEVTTCEGLRKECRKREVCVNALTNCGRNRCPIEARCVPDLDECGGITCPQNQECVRTVAYDCPDSTCPREPTCVRRRDAKQSCKATDKRCRRKKACRNVLIECSREPCPIEALCLPCPKSGKPGRCPRSSDIDNPIFRICEEDNDCPNRKKCCRHGQRTVCKDPL